MLVTGVSVSVFVDVRSNLSDIRGLQRFDGELAADVRIDGDRSLIPDYRSHFQHRLPTSAVP
jgi:hypothetical protein